MGEIRKRGGVYWIRYYRAGKRYEESSGSDKKGKAVDLLKLREGDIAHGVPVTPAIGRLLFDEAAAAVINDYAVNGKRSLEAAKRRLKLHLKPYFGGRKMATIGADVVLGYVAERQKAEASNATINRELSLLKRAFSLAIRHGRLLTKPHIAMLAENNVRTGFFEREDFEAVRAQLPAYLRGVATVAYFTGWRVPSEVLPLEWSRVDRQAGTLRLDPGATKNGKGRTFPYSVVPELQDAIEAAWLEHEALKKKGTICPLVFQHRGGKPIRDFRDSWKTATEAAGCPGRIPHDFRRTAVRNLVRAGVSEVVAMTMTGHLTRSVFDRYDIVDEADLATAASRLAGAGTKKGQSSEKGRLRRFRRKG